MGVHLLHCATMCVQVVRLGEPPPLARDWNGPHTLTRPKTLVRCLRVGEGNPTFYQSEVLTDEYVKHHVSIYIHIFLLLCVPAVTECRTWVTGYYGKQSSNVQRSVRLISFCDKDKDCIRSVVHKLLSWTQIVKRFLIDAIHRIKRELPKNRC